MDLDCALINENAGKQLINTIKQLEIVKHGSLACSPLFQRLGLGLDSCEKKQIKTTLIEKNTIQSKKEQSSSPSLLLPSLKSLSVPTLSPSPHEINVSQRCIINEHDGLNTIQVDDSMDRSRTMLTSMPQNSNRVDGTAHHLSKIARMYTQSLCNVNQVNVSHPGDNARRKIEGSTLQLIPYTVDDIEQVSKWFADDEELQDIFLLSGNVNEEKLNHEKITRSHFCQGFVIQELLPIKKIARNTLQKSGTTSDVLQSRHNNKNAHKLKTSNSQQLSSNFHRKAVTIGRINLSVPHEDQQVCVQTNCEWPQAEIELFIGDQDNRRRGLGHLAIQLLAAYAVFAYGCRSLRAIVEECNIGAMNFFSNIGFKPTTRDDTRETTCFELGGDALMLFVQRPSKVMLKSFIRPKGNDTSILKATLKIESRQKLVQRMKLCTLTNSRIKLVPYQRDHISHYHEWMTDPYILKMTASEPLSMIEEFNMMHEWLDDPDKLTYIITCASDARVESGGCDITAMAGDVNLFFNDLDDPYVAEIDVMVAEAKYQRKHFALEAVQLLMKEAKQQLGVIKFRAKILADNVPSINLFKKLGFREENRVEVFNEIHFISKSS